MYKRTDSKPAVGSKDKPEEKKTLAGAGSEVSPHPERLDKAEAERIARERLKGSMPTVYKPGHLGAVTGGRGGFKVITKTVSPEQLKELKNKLETEGGFGMNMIAYEKAKRLGKDELDRFVTRAMKRFGLSI